MRQPLVVIGLDGDALGSAAAARLAAAEVLAGAARHLDRFARHPAEKLALAADLDGFIAAVRSIYPARRTVVLASGDPLFFGIGRRLRAAIPETDLVFLPAVSAVQTAFARIGLNWDDACVVSLHGRPLQRLLPALRRGEPKIAALTDDRNTPAAIARLLLDRGRTDYRLWVCEQLGAPDERITAGGADEISRRDFAALNVVILVRNGRPAAAAPPLLGLPETALRHDGGMITKRTVRLTALAELALRGGDVLWDIGAGSGAVALEAAGLAPTVTVYALERDPDRFAQLAANLEAFGYPNLHAMPGAAPAAIAALPDPDAVFIGGSGGALGAILAAVAARLQPGGRVVLNCITLEHLHQAWEMLRELKFEPAATSIQVAHSRPIGPYHGFEPERPIVVLRGTRPP